MRVGVDVSQHHQEWPELRARVQFAEEAGFDGAWLFDHFFPLYGDPVGPCVETWTAMAALAGCTERIRLGTLVTGVTYRHPSILATQAVTVDHASGGRLEMSIGAAWNGDEHEVLGLDFQRAGERADRLEEAILVMKALWTQDHATFEGRNYQLHDATYRPRPVQQPHPPLWVGAGGPRRTIPIAARHADVWHSFGSVPEMRRKSALLDEHAARAGRDPASITRATNLSLSEPWQEVRRTALQMRDIGISYLVASWPEAGRRRVQEFVDGIMPELVAA